jgi:hypothetical protein
VVAHQQVAFGELFSRVRFDEANILCSAECTHPAICTGKFLSDFSKFEMFNAQELDDMMLF